MRPLSDSPVQVHSDILVQWAAEMDNRMPEVIVVTAATGYPSHSHETRPEQSLAIMGSH